MGEVDLLVTKIVFFASTGFLASYLISRVLSKIYEFIMHRFGTHHYEIAEKLEGPISTLLKIGVVFLILKELSAPPIYLKLTEVAAVLVAGFAAGGVVEPLLKTYMERMATGKRVFAQFIPILRDVIKIGIIAVVIIISLLVMGVDVGPLVASAGLMGAAIAFAAQNIIADFFYGLVILFDKRIRPGDFVNLGSYSGKVIEIGVLSTKIETWDATQLTIPNSVIGKEYIENLHMPIKLSKVKMKIGVSYDSNIKTVKETLRKILESHPKILKEPKPGVFFTGMLDSALEFTIIGYVEKPEDRFTTAAELREMIIKEFRKKKIDIPYPITTVYLKRMK